MSNYNVYLQSPWWKDRRWHKLRSVNFQCEFANCTEWRRLEVHHKHYNSLHKEEDGDLEVLCRKHHIARHMEDKMLKSDEYGDQFDRIVVFRRWVDTNILFPTIPDAVVDPLRKLLIDMEERLVLAMYRGGQLDTYFSVEEVEVEK